MKTLRGLNSIWYLGGFKLPPQADHVNLCRQGNIYKKRKNQENSHFCTKVKFPEK